jgi:16S rRNA (guanine966-N2)-methyltransferase
VAEMMNIVSGIAKGIVLETPKGLSVRPTGARAKKSIFDSYRNWAGKTVVDLFAGTGALGLEAASRGAVNVYFIEKIYKNCKMIANNIERVKKAGVNANMEVICFDALSVHKRLPMLRGKIDVIFADPPYNIADETSGKIFNNNDFADWASEALFIFEAPSEASRKPIFDNFGLWKVQSRRKLGQSVFFMLSVNN